MALLTDDQDIREVYFKTLFGGNGDYYFELYELKDGEFIKVCHRFAMSGGNAPTDVKLAVAKLHWAMEEAGLNEYPNKHFLNNNTAPCDVCRCNPCSSACPKDK